MRRNSLASLRMPECKHTKILTTEHLRTKKREELTSLSTSSNYFIFQE